MGAEVSDLPDGVDGVVREGQRSGLQSLTMDGLVDFQGFGQTMKVASRLFWNKGEQALDFGGALGVRERSFWHSLRAFHNKLEQRQFHFILWKQGAQKLGENLRLWHESFIGS